MWYAFYGAEHDDDAAFELRMDEVVREIGDRGRLVMPEAIPPEAAPAPATMREAWGRRRCARRG